MKTRKLDFEKRNKPSKQKENNVFKKYKVLLYKIYVLIESKVISKSCNSR